MRESTVYYLQQSPSKYGDDMLFWRVGVLGRGQGNFGPLFSFPVGNGLKLNRCDFDEENKTSQRDGCMFRNIDMIYMINRGGVQQTP